MEARDFLRDEDGDLAFYLGDLAVGNSDLLHKEDIIQVNTGEFKEFPLLGVGIRKFLNAPRIQNLDRIIRIQFEYDNYRVDKIEFKDVLVDTKSVTVDAVRLQGS